jgi:hypothetical protein
MSCKNGKDYISKPCAIVGSVLFLLAMEHSMLDCWIENGDKDINNGIDGCVAIKLKKAKRK